MGPGARFLILTLSLASGSSLAADRCRKPDCSMPEEDGERDGESSSSRCRTWKGGEQSAMVVSGRIFSSDSFCRAPLTEEAVSAYLGCANSSRFQAEPFARWKTGKDGAFEVSAPVPPGTRHAKMELCVAARRGCRTLTLDTPDQDPSGAASISAAGQRVTRSRVDGKGRQVKVDLCLGERKRRGFGWDDEDMSWLKRKSPGNGVWSEGAQWTKQAPLGKKDFLAKKKRLWEGADEEVGWFKRRSPGGVESPPPGENDGKRSREFLSDDEDERRVPMDDYQDDRHSVIPVTGGHSDESMTLGKEDFQSFVVRGRSRHLPTRWSQPEAMKK